MKHLLLLPLMLIAASSIGNVVARTVVVRAVVEKPQINYTRPKKANVVIKKKKVVRSDRFVVVVAAAQQDVDFQPTLNRPEQEK